jgi:hypothetical protein
MTTNTVQTDQSRSPRPDRNRPANRPRHEKIEQERDKETRHREDIRVIHDPYSSK